MTRPEHFRRYVGEIVKVVGETTDGESKQARGRLVSCEEGRIRVEDSEHGEVAFDLDAVRRAKLDPDLDFGGKRTSR